MKGIELAKGYYETFGKAMLEEFPDVLPEIAAGVLGSGSEWLGFDDKTSRDHDFGPGFMIFLPGEDRVSRRQEFLLERAYAKLPSEFLGVSRERLSPVGGNRFGVRRMAEFFARTVGREDGALTLREFLTIPEQYLLEATNGEVFYDGSGALTEMRAALSRFPEDVRLKKLAGELVTLAQSAPYNFERCLSHGETAAAELSLVAFTNAALHIAFLLNRQYMPFYKWQYRAAAALKEFSQGLTPRDLAGAAEYLITHENAGEALPEKRRLIDLITSETVTAVREALDREGMALPDGERPHAAANPYRISGVLKESGTRAESSDPGRLAEAVNGLIRDNDLRTMHILSGV